MEISLILVCLHVAFSSTTSPQLTHIHSHHAQAAQSTISPNSSYVIFHSILISHFSVTQCSKSRMKSTINQRNIASLHTPSLILALIQQIDEISGNHRWSVPNSDALTMISNHVCLYMLRAWCITLCPVCLLQIFMRCDVILCRSEFMSKYEGEVKG